MSLIIIPSTLPNSITTVGSTYSTTISATGGIEPYRYRLISGSLPPGITGNTDGTFFGTFTTIGNYPFTVRATDSTYSVVGNVQYGNVGTHDYAFLVRDFTPVSNIAVEVYVAGALQTTGYTVINTDPVSIEFDNPPLANVEVTILVKRAESWYQPGLFTPSDGQPLQQTNTEAARFLRGL